MPPPRIIEHPINTELPATEIAEFKCIGQGYGFVDVRWLRIKNDKERSPPRKATVTTMVTPDNITTITSVLTIPDLMDGNRGPYWCIYNNSGGETPSETAILAIGSKCY